jgi:predicted Rossmann-fold nucleotide-binding protein
MLPKARLSQPFCRDRHRNASAGVRGMQQMSRNHINVLSSDVLVALPGGQGTASEVMLALRYERPVVAYLGESGSIPSLPASVPVTQSIEEVASFLQRHMSSLRAAQGV